MLLFLSSQDFNFVGVKAKSNAVTSLTEQPMIVWEALSCNIYRSLAQSKDHSGIETIQENIGAHEAHCKDRDT
jgi:hypothetical protein